MTKQADCTLQHPNPESAVLADLDAATATRLDEAHCVYMARRSGWEKPAGHMDKHGRWYPDAAEAQDCCALIRPPSRKWPMSLYKHACTMPHIAAAADVSTDLLQALHRERHPAGREGGEGYFKQVVVQPDGTMVSMRDNTTTWAIGETNFEGVGQEFRGGLFVFGDVDAAKLMDVPSKADGILGERAIVECRCAGNYVRYADEHIWKDGRRVGVSRVAFTKVTPIRVVSASPLAEEWLLQRNIFVQVGGK